MFLLFPAKHYQVQTAEEQKKAAEQRKLDIVNQSKINQQQPEIPVRKFDTAIVHAIKVNEKLPVAAFKNFSGGVTVDFKKGTEIVAVLNTGCGDCIEAATGIGKLISSNQRCP